MKVETKFVLTQKRFIKYKNLETMQKILSVGKEKYQQRMNMRAKQDYPTMEWPKPESYINDYGVDFFNDHRMHLEMMGMVTDSDIKKYQMCSYYYGEWRQLADDIRDQGYTYTNVRGDLCLNPAAATHRQIFIQLNKLLQSFGFNFGDRVVLGIDGEHQKKQLDAHDEFTL